MSQVLTRWIEGKAAAEHRLLLPPDLLNHQPRFLHLHELFFLHNNNNLNLLLSAPLNCLFSFPLWRKTYHKIKTKTPKTQQIQDFMTQATFPMSQKFSIIAHHNSNNLPAQHDMIKDGIFLCVPLSLLITF